MSNSPAPSTYDRGFFGHPTGLAILFFTEMWERFSYYGMRGLLILYLTADYASGGMNFDVAKATAIYALYTSMVYLVGLPGGWIGDRLWGQRKSVLYGGVLITIGHIFLAVHPVWAFYTGLVFIVLGTGLLKPNISAIVGQLYRADDVRRDSGFSLFYMGINFGAFFGPLLCGWLGENYDWHLGFGAAAVGMALGLVQYVWGGRYLGDVGLVPAGCSSESERQGLQKKFNIGLVSFAALAIGLVLAGRAGMLTIEAEQLANYFGVLLLIITTGFFTWLFRSGDWTPVERGRLWSIVVLFLAAVFFWAAYEQSGSSFNLFARDWTNLTVLGRTVSPSQLQSLSALFVIICAPFFAWLWIRLGKRQPSSPTKFSLGLIFVGLGFAVMILAALKTRGGHRVGIEWLAVTYFLHVIGEMCLSPVGLSTVTKLAPQRVTGLMMGVWFLAASVGSYLGGRMAGFYESMPLWQLFGIVAAVTIVGGFILAMLSKSIQKMMGGVH